MVERESWPGGRAGRVDVDGYKIDTGPTVLTMPDIIETPSPPSARRFDLLAPMPIDPAYSA